MTAAALLMAAAGLVVLVRALRAVASRAAAVAGGVLLLAGTSLAWVVWPAPDATAAAAFLLSAAAVAWTLRGPTGLARLASSALLLAAALALALGTGMRGLEPPRLGEALFSSRHGLLFWNPLLWGGLFGLARGWRRDAQAAGAVTVGLVTAIVVLAAAPAGASGPWATRRWTAVLPLLAPGLAIALDALAAAAARRPGVLLAPAGGLLVAWNLLFMEQYRSGQVPRDATVSFAAVAETSARRLASLFGSPLAWPANWAFAWRRGLPPDRFDLLAGKRLPGESAGKPEVDVGEPSLDAALLLDGWSVRHPCAEAVCRDVEGRARLLAPLAEPGEFVLAVRAAGEGALSAAVNGRDLGAQPLGPGLTLLRFPGASWARHNEVSLRLHPGSRARVDRLRLERTAGTS
jgi:hypothetical protein